MPLNREVLNTITGKPNGGGTFTMSFESATLDDIEPETETISERARILREAEKNVCGQREQDYGSPESNFQLIADLWADYLGTSVSAKDVAMMMVLLKVARIKNGGGSGDSFVDIAGYAACGGEIWRDTSAQ